MARRKIHIRSGDNTVSKVQKRIKIKSSGNSTETPGKTGSSSRGLLLIGTFSLLVCASSLYLLIGHSWDINDMDGTEVRKNHNSSDNDPFSLIDYYRLSEDESLIDATFQLGIDDTNISRLVRLSRDKVKSDDVANSLVQLFVNQESPTHKRLLFIPNPPLYQVILEFGDTLFAVREENPINLEIHKRGHRLYSDDLFTSLFKEDFSLEFIQALDEVLEWSVDLHHITANSKFDLKAIFEETYADQELISVTISAIEFSLNGKKQSLFRFSDGKYYDQNGVSSQKQFLKAPVKYSRISSTFGFRLNPISGKPQKHKGIDFAAPIGTPIRSLGRGVIEKAEFTKGNGYYIKIRHDDIYQTQYLHMSGFAEGVMPGKDVEQGSVIGYVGVTGQTNGPHVCLRFWKNGEQVDFFEEEISRESELSSGKHDQFMLLRDSLRQELLEIQI